MLLLSTLLVSALASTSGGQGNALLAAVPEDAFALLHLGDPIALRRRAELNDWVRLLESPAGKPVLQDLEGDFERGTGTDLHGLFSLALELHGESLLFFTGSVAGFLTEPPTDRAALGTELERWLADQPRRAIEIQGARVQVAPWPEDPDGPLPRAGHFLAVLDHPSAMGLYSGDSEEDLVRVVTESLGGLLAGGRRSSRVEQFLAAGGGTARGIEAFVDFTPFVAEAEEALRRAAEAMIPDPTGLLGLEGGTWLFATLDISPGTRIEMSARLEIPKETLAAALADSFEPLPRTLPAELPRDAWFLHALDWNLNRFYATARKALERGEDGSLAMIDQGLETAKMLSGVDPVVDVLEQLSGLFALYHVQLAGDETPTEEEGFGFLAGLVDGDRFLKAFERLLGEDGLGIEPIRLEGAQTYLMPQEESASPDDPQPSQMDGGVSVLPRRLLASLSRETLVRGLRALGHVEGAGLGWDSQLQAALDENAGAFAFSYAELRHLRSLLLLQEADPSAETPDPFDSQFIFAAQRTPAGMEARLHTR